MLVERRTESLAAPFARRGLAGAADRGTTGECLEAADVAAAADDRTLVDDLDVAHVTGTALGAAVEAAVGDDPGADARADLDDDHVVMAHRGAAAPLAQAEQVDVVVDPDRRVVGRGEAGAHRIAVPAGHDRWRDRRAGAELDRPGHADADAPQVAGQAARRRAQLGEELVDAVEAALGAVADVGRLVAVSENPSVERGHRDVDARGAQVGDEDVAGLGVEVQLAWRPATGAPPEATLAHEAALDQLAHPLGDDRATETGPRDELRARA